MDYKTLINTFSTIRATSDIKRYSRDRLTDTESVLQHIGWVSIFSLIIADHLQSNSNIKIDYEKLFKRVVIHDFDETITGDVPRPTKYYSKEVTQVFKQVEDVGIQKILGGLSVSSSIYDAWKSSKDHTVEGMILKISDLFAVAYMCWLEVLMYNNMSFIRVMRESRKYVDSLFTELLSTSWEDVVNITYLKSLKDSVNVIYEECEYRASVMNVNKTSTQFLLSNLDE